ncbi:hypothetical protein ANO14919_050910 [Xylariales sp. No.14919]|nr:hypothetical protein ANO14919_050910 [Xylariales sp. No.14919]
MYLIGQVAGLFQMEKSNYRKWGDKTGMLIGGSGGRLLQTLVDRPVTDYRQWTEKTRAEDLGGSGHANMCHRPTSIV